MDHRRKRICKTFSLTLFLFMWYLNAESKGFWKTRPLHIACRSFRRSHDGIWRSWYLSMIGLPLFLCSTVSLGSLVSMLEIRLVWNRFGLIVDLRSMHVFVAHRWWLLMARSWSVCPDMSKWYRSGSVARVLLAAAVPLVGILTNQELIGRWLIFPEVRVKYIDLAILSSTKDHINIGIIFNIVFESFFL